MKASAKLGSAAPAWAKLAIAVCMLALGICTLAFSASAATLTDEDELGRFGSEGSGAGQLSSPRASAADPATGHLYVADDDNNRIDEFTPWGDFVKAFGWDVAPGAVNEQQEVRVRAGAGGFKLTFGAATTPDLSFDVTAAEVQSALNGLASIGGAGGSVTVEEALGNNEVATPFVYVIAFKGALAGKDVAQLSAANGATPLSAGNPETGLEVRTRAQGTPGGTGLESCTTESGCQEGSAGGGPGQFGKRNANLAFDDAGDLYALDPGNLRVQRFAPDGSLLGSFGGDVVAHGPGDSTNDEVQEVIVAATGGAFKLSFEAEAVKAQTSSLPYNASAAEVKAALNALASIGGIGGSVTVSGGPGDATGSKPYAVTFEGNLGGDDVAPLVLDSSALAAPANSGYSLECGQQVLEDGSERIDPSLLSFQWLRNGVPIPGATAKAYTTTAADEGKAVQCQAFAIAANAGDTSIATPARIVSPAPAEAAPVPPDARLFALRNEQGVRAQVAAGEKITCPISDPGWTGASTFAYAWYRNGVPIPGATSPTYTVTAADVASPAALQCVVSGANAEGTALSVQSLAAYTSPQPSPLPPGANPSGEEILWARMTGPSRSLAAHQGGGMEVCTVASGDACKAARPGWGPEQLGGSGSGLGSLAVAADGTAFVGEGAAIKEFQPGGGFERAVATPLDASFGMTFARDPLSGDFYAVAGSGSIIHRLDPATGGEVDSLTANGSVGDIATDAAGDVFAVVPVPNSNRSKVAEFDPEGHLVSHFAEAEKTPSGIGSSAQYNLTGFGTNALGDLYISNTQSAGKQGAFIRAFGPGPVSLESPPLRPPEISVQYAASVSRTEAELRAKINPRFWNDTSYRVQYGTAPCEEGGCGETAEANLTRKVFGSPVTTQGVFLEGLEPATAYHYRFVAESTGGGPVYGPERTFTTYRSPEAPECPENESFRSGPSAALPDCRAYEMVSPPEKEGGDIVVLGETTTILPAALNQSAADGGRFAYGSYRAFGDATSASYTTQYIASREAGAGWSSHAISPPRELRLGGFVNTFDTEFKAFSPDLCQGWLETFAEPALAPEAPAGYPNLYRRTDSECGGPSYEALNTVTPANIAAGQPAQDNGPLDPELEGLSEDGQAAIFLANDRLGEEAPPQPAKCAEFTGACKEWLYATGGGSERFVCALPSGNPYPGSCFAGGSPRGPSRDRGSNLAGAISADGSKVFWTAVGVKSKIYERVNPLAAQSAVPLGFANGTGNLSTGSKQVAGLVAAKGKAAIAIGSKVATLTEAPSVGRFVAGQPLNTVSGIPSGTSVVSCSSQCGEGAETLTLNNAATATKEVTLTSKGPMPFAAGQRIAAPGIPLGTTITAAKENELTLSAAATVTLSGAPLEAWGKCSEAAKACTVPVSEAAEAETGTEESAGFQLAAKDGSRVLFTVGNNQVGQKLYEFRSADESTHPIAGKVLGLMGASEDATRVYLASQEALSGASAEGRSPTAGQPNLYLYEGGAFRFIGALASEELGESALSPIGSEPAHRISRVAPDGLAAAFTSRAALTGYDNADEVTGVPDAEVYLYDAAGNGGEGKLICASCNPGGARPRGANVKEGQITIQAAAHIPVFENNLYASRVLSDDGQRLFFDAADALVPSDANGRSDVYQWEAPGTGSCSEESPSYSPPNGGCVDLISSGQSKLDSEFLDASPSGDDVFFATLSSFVGQDYGLVDAYDARVGGGLPAPPAPAASCEGEACQGTPEAPNDPTPASESFQGAGNVHEEPQAQAPKPCAKGKVKRHGKCVRKHKSHKRAKRHRRAGR